MLDSVRAARNLAPGDTASRFAVWGHSKGGHAALFICLLARDYAAMKNRSMSGSLKR